MDLTRWRADAAPPTLLLDGAVVWVVGTVVRRSLFTAITGSLWPFPPLPLLEKAGLVAFGFVAGVPSVLLITLGLALLTVAPRLPRMLAPVARLAGLGLAFGVEFFMFLSWATYYDTREFLNADLLSLFAASPMQVIEHIVQIAPVAIVAVPGVAAAVLTVTWLACRRVRQWPARRARALVTGVGAILAGSLIVAVWAEPATRRGGDDRSPHDQFVNAAAEQSGPSARILADMLHVISRAEDRLAAWPSNTPASRDLITMDAYVRRVDRSTARRWNVIVVIVESLRADELTMFGGVRVVMPAVEALAREGVAYGDAITQASHTDYATTSTLSSQYPLRSPEFAPFPARIPYPRVLLWDVLKPLGYRTAVFSSQNEHWQGMYDFLNTGGVEHFLHAETFDGATYTDIADVGFFQWARRAGRAGKIDDADTIDEAIAWTDSIAPSAPFFAYVNLQSSHTPYLRPKSFAPRFGSGQVSFRIGFGTYPADSAAAVRDMYDNSLAYADAQLARLIAVLKQDGRWDSTVMVVLGDHGEAFYEHGFGAHGASLYREVTHIPLVIRVPGVVARRDSLPAAAIDVAPTVLGVLGLPPHPGFQGMDLADTASRRHRPIFSLAQTGLATEVAVEQDHWKMRFNLYHSDFELFDLRNDPLETRDVSAEHAVQRHELMETIGIWWSSQLRYYRTLPAVPLNYAPVMPIRSALAPP